MDLQTADSVASGHASELGAFVRRCGSGPGSTWVLIGVGVFMIVVPILPLIAADPRLYLPVLLLFEVPFLPLGAWLIRSGLRQRKVLLTIYEEGFEYLDADGNVRITRFVEVQRVALRKVRDLPESIEVHLKDGSLLSMKCLSLREGFTLGYEDLERRV